MSFISWFLDISLFRKAGWTASWNFINSYFNGPFADGFHHENSKKMNIILQRYSIWINMFWKNLKHPCRSLFFKKCSARPATSLKRNSGTDVFQWILQNFQDSFLQNASGWLLLKVILWRKYFSTETARNFPQLLLHIYKQQWDSLFMRYVCWSK